MTLFLSEILDPKPRFQKKKFLLDTIFSQCVLCLTLNNSTSQNIVEDRCMGRSTSQMLGNRPPVPPKSSPVSSVTVAYCTDYIKFHLAMSINVLYMLPNTCLLLGPPSSVTLFMDGPRSEQRQQLNTSRVLKKFWWP